jgi:hypothetical protein
MDNQLLTTERLVIISSTHELGIFVKTPLTVFNLALRWRGPCGPIDLQRGGHFENEGVKEKKSIGKNQ